MQDTGNSSNICSVERIDQALERSTAQLHRVARVYLSMGLEREASEVLETIARIRDLVPEADEQRPNRNQ